MSLPHRTALLMPFLVLLAACATPAPEFFGAERHELTVGGRRFVVFHKGDRAEVVRLGYLTRSERRAVPALMAQAVERATGCRMVPGSMVTGVPGDAGEARVDLDC